MRIGTHPFLGVLDSDFAQRRHATSPCFRARNPSVNEKRLDHLIASRRLATGANAAPADWANQSFQLAKKVWVNDGGAVDESYYKNDIAIVDQRLALAGVRLAALINQVLGNRGDLIHGANK